MIQAERQSSNVIEEENPQYLDDPECPFSVVNAMNRLKETEDKLYLMKNRLHIIKEKESKKLYKSMENSRKTNAIMEISEFAKQQKERKVNNNFMRMLTIDHLKLNNQNKRQTHQKKVEQFRSTHMEKKRMMMSYYKKERESNYRKIRENKQKQLNSKKSKRDCIYHGHRETSNRVEEYLQNKRLDSLMTKEEQKMAITSKIKEREDMIKALEEESTLYEQQPSLLTQSRRSKSHKYSTIVQKGDKGFRVKFMSKKQGLVYL